MTKYSYSRVDTFVQCPKRFEYKYVKGIEPDVDIEEDSPLLLGKCMDTGIEHGVEAALELYESEFPYQSQKKQWETMKLEYWINRLHPHFKGGQFQIELENDYFLGYADWYKDGHLVDFKYANPKNAEKYRNSAQLHLYCDIMTRQGYEVKDMTYVVIPKTFIRQKKGESLQMFRNRLVETLDALEPIQIQVDFDPEHIQRFGRNIERITMANVHDDFPPIVSKLCDYCPYKDMCQPNH